MLIGVIFRSKVDEILQEMELIKHLVDAAEIRLDYFEDWGALALLKEKAVLPLVFTFRRKNQGGRLAIAEEKRLELFEKALLLKPSFADIEADTDRRWIDRVGALHPEIKWIGSHHDFEKTPDDLDGLLRSMQHRCFSIYKIALHARSSLDLLRFMVWAKQNADRVALSCISLGLDGQPSRVLGQVMGNALNYSSLDDSMNSLYHYSLDTLHQVFGFSRLNQQTKIYALLGDPVAESPGDLFHNQKFREEGIHAVYVKLRLNASELEEFFSLSQKLPFAGFSVTRPLKEVVLPFLSRIDEPALAMKAVNTILVERSEWIGFNTDAPGALHALELHGLVKGKKVAILGAGGSARAIAYEAMRRGADVMVFNRTMARAEKLAKDFGCKAYALDALASHPYEVLINTIPSEASKNLPILAGSLREKSVFMDINHTSTLLQAAQSRGCRCILGKAMFEEQAQLQQKIWTKKTY